MQKFVWFLLSLFPVLGHAENPVVYAQPPSVPVTEQQAWFTDYAKAGEERSALFDRAKNLAVPVKERIAAYRQQSEIFHSRVWTRERQVAMAALGGEICDTLSALDMVGDAGGLDLDDPTVVTNYWLHRVTRLVSVPLKDGRVITFCNVGPQDDGLEFQQEILALEFGADRRLMHIYRSPLNGQSTKSGDVTLTEYYMREYSFQIAGSTQVSGRMPNEVHAYQFPANSVVLTGPAPIPPGQAAPNLLVRWNTNGTPFYAPYVNNVWIAATNETFNFNGAFMLWHLRFDEKEEAKPPTTVWNRNFVGDAHGTILVQNAAGTGWDLKSVDGLHCLVANADGQSSKEVAVGVDFGDLSQSLPQEYWSNRFPDFVTLFPQRLGQKLLPGESSTFAAHQKGFLKKTGTDTVVTTEFSYGNGEMRASRHQDKADDGTPLFHTDLEYRLSADQGVLSVHGHQTGKGVRRRYHLYWGLDPLANGSADFNCDNLVESTGFSQGVLVNGVYVN